MEYVGAAMLANTIYGAATGESGGLIGEAFGVQDKADAAAAKAKQDALDRASALQARQDEGLASLKTDLGPVAVAPVAPVAPVPTPPTVTPPAAMPTVSTSLLQARRESVAMMRKRQGRASTILTQSTSDTLG